MLPKDRFFLYVIVTHEARSSTNEDIFAPFARINDGSMYLVTVDPSSKYDILKYLGMFSSGTHVNHRNFNFYQVDELKISNPKGTRFWMDGEIYQSDDVHIKFLPNSLNLIGKVSPLSPKMIKFRSTKLK